MACLGKITKNLLWNCEAAQVNPLGGITEAILINQSDIASYSATSPEAATVNLNQGAKGYVVQSVNNGIKVAIAKKGGELYPNLLDVTVTILLPNEALNSTATGMANAFVNASLAIACKTSDGYFIVGLGAPLSCTETTADSSASQYITCVYGVDEFQSGTSKYGLSGSVYESLKEPAV